MSSSKLDMIVGNDDGLVFLLYIVSHITGEFLGINLVV